LIGYAARRILLALPLLFGAASLVFLLIHLIPGDPAQVMLGAGATAADVAALRHRLGLDQPIAAQYVRFLLGLARGDLGRSIHYDESVASLLSERLPATLVLAVATLTLAIVTAAPVGLLAAIRPGGIADRATSTWAAVALAVPSFWLGPLLVLLFAIRLDWLPVSGIDPASAVVLPAATMAFSIAALLARLLRVALGGETGSLYVRAAMARGLSRPLAIARHALRNALGPALTALALQTGSLLTGAILTETIFAWPGLGRLLVRAIGHRDYPLIQGCVLLFAALYFLSHLLCDLARAGLDPRLRPA
jgi:peptide/nickel transport system permease protein